ncbi:YdbH domain-containing protein [Novosphingobium sp. PASSN1]|uniref:intermembrane phospholipid transport protein YdbH family protein n=1 Tax=Novosphingobium sp. PASSN1 TaxID=2015561 RepID=UPI0025E3FC98|nr:YdbH domain-containing protein [Novosphingobium sp. PASSN1]
MPDESEPVTESPDEAAAAPRRSKRKYRKTALISAGAFAALAAGLWSAREQIAQRLIDRQLTQMGLPGRYAIQTIGADRQVLRDLVIGDPAHPDLTIARAELRLSYGLLGPRIGQIILDKPRLYGTYRQGKLSFGALDSLLFPKDSTAPAGLPDLDLQLIDGRALLESEYGRLAVKAEGAGNLAGGFAGKLAAVMPTVAAGGCAGEGLSAYGKVSVSSGKPRFAGPVRLAGLVCGKTVAAGPAALALDVTGDKDFGGAAAKAKLEAGKLAVPGLAAARLGLGGELALKAGGLRGHLTGEAGGVRTAGLVAGTLGVDGDLDARFDAGRGADSLVFRGGISGRGLARGAASEQALAGAQAAAAGTLVAPLIARLRGALAREERGSRLTGDVVLRREGAQWTLVAPSAVLRGGSGAALLAVSRLQVAAQPGKLPRLTGNFVMAGDGLPPISGRMEPGAGGRPALRLRMADYRVGADRLALPLLEVAQGPGGALTFSGTVQASGALPGGAVRGAVLPIAGTLSPRGDLALWPRCVTPSFASLAVGAVTLDERRLTICPAGGRAIVQSGPRGLSAALGISALALSGRMGETPLVLTTGPVGLAWPGTLTVRGADVVLGPQDTATRMRLTNLVARLGKDFTGTFDGVDAKLAAVPLDITGAAGDWRYAGGVLTLSGVRFAAADRLQPARFKTLAGEDAVLTLKDNRVTAEALVREPDSRRDVMRVSLRHDLATARGHADLTVDGLVFDKGKIVPGKVGGLQPKTLAPQFQGVIADAEGTVRGKGVVDWSAETVTSSGAFGTDKLDFSAAFGLVHGVSGTLEFTDLIGMVTAPHQTLRVASANPGIEVTDGVVDIELLAGQVVRINSGLWPFLGGRLKLAQGDLRLTVNEPRRFRIEIEGIDAAKFLERMELANLSATGTFDGRLPLEFDANGGRITGGQLISRPPGGTVSYVGALSYKDLSAMANFAFDALKSLDYSSMTIGMDGNLAGDVVTRVEFTGIKQGKDTKQNFVTRQIGKIPVKFNVNIHAPFYSLISSMNPQPPPGALNGLPGFTEPASGVQPPASSTKP